jgi:DNA polymerase I-like protein with 3'-5' exonuclease and polymerase domains
VSEPTSLDGFSGDEQARCIFEGISANTIEPSDGFGLVVVSFPDLELRLLGTISGDQLLQTVLEAGQSAEQELARDYYNNPTERPLSTAEEAQAAILRQEIANGREANQLVTALCNPRLAKQTGYDHFHETFPRAAEWLQTQNDLASEQGRLTNPFGRTLSSFFLCHPSSECQYHRAARALLQSAAADVRKVALLRLATALSQGCFVACVGRHRLIFEVPEQQISEASEYMRQLLEQPPHGLEATFPATVTYQSSSNRGRRMPQQDGI